MSDSEEEKEIPMPKHRIRFTDMESKVVEKAIRLIEVANQKHKLDKDVATEIKTMLDKEPMLLGIIIVY